MQLKYFDAHTHVQFAAFEKDWKEVVGRAQDGGVGMINVGTQKDTSCRAVEVAHEYENSPVFATVGLHPIHTAKSYYDSQELGATISNSRELEKDQLKGFMSRAEEFNYEYYKKLAFDPKVVAIGECGLDYFRIKNDESGIKEKQKKAFVEQIKLAYEVKKPLMIHCRDAERPKNHAECGAFADLIEILIHNSKFLIPEAPGIIHFFSGTKDEAGKLLAMGFYFTFGGVVTFSRDYDEVIKMIPLERIFSETDAPYVTPVSHRGERNEPLYVIEVVKKLAEIKSLPLEEMEKQLLQNVKRLFNIV